MGDLLAHLRSNLRLYVGLFAGAGLTQAAGYALVGWGPEFLRRHYGWTIQHAGYALGLTGLTAGIGGTLVAAAMSRLLERNSREDGTVPVCIAGLVIGAGLAIAGPLQPSPYVFLGMAALASFCLTGVSNNVLVAMQLVAPTRMRATLVALLLMSITLFGLGLGPAGVAMISARFPAQGLGLGVLAGAVAVPALLLLLCSRGRYAQLRRVAV